MSFWLRNILFLGWGWIKSKIKRNKNPYDTESLSDESSFTVVATTSLRMTNRPLSKLKSKISYRDHKRTWQGVSNVFLPYILLVQVLP